jgi:hypothetical protein
MRTAPPSADDALLARLQAPPDLREGTDALAYWRGRRQRLPWYRIAARREAARMSVAWEQRVRAALVRQRGLPTEARLRAARLVAGIWLRRSLRRVTLALAGTAMVLLVLAPALLLLDLLVHVLS